MFHESGISTENCDTETRIHTNVFNEFGIGINNIESEINNNKLEYRDKNPYKNGQRIFDRNPNFESEMMS